MSFDSINKAIYSLLKTKIGIVNTPSRSHKKLADPILDNLCHAKHFTTKCSYYLKTANSCKTSNTLVKFAQHITKHIQPHFPEILSPDRNNLSIVLSQLNKAHKHRNKTVITKAIKDKIEKRNEDMLSNPKAFFRNILTKFTKSKKEWLMDQDGSSYLDTDNKLRIHTQFWNEIYSHPTSPPPTATGWFNHPIALPVNFTYPTCIEEFTEALGSSFKAPGPSNIPFEVIKALPHEAKMVIIGKINTILKNGVIPDIWRTAKINLLSKDLASSNLPSTYRPISLLDTTYKIVSAILHLRLIKHIKQHCIIHISQSGYSKYMLTASNIVTLNNILEDAAQFDKKSISLP